MSSSKIYARAFLTILLTLAISGCASTTKIVSAITSKPIEVSALTGLPGRNGPVLAVKIDDTPPAHPQVGVEDADVVYIEQVEGGLTRLLAIYSGKIPSRIGPVRSARISDIDILAQYGQVAFAFSGVQQKMLPVVASANLVDLSAMRQGPSIYANDPTRTPPTAMMLQAALLMQQSLAKSLPIDSAKNMGWRFGKAPDTGTAIASVKMKWPANSYTATWSPLEKRWLLTHGAIPNLAESGKTLGPTTLVLQMVAITASIYHDKVGGITPFSATVGSGKGFILRDGKSIPAIWSRPAATSGTTWSLATGEEILFAPGQIWVALLDTAPVFTPALASAPPSASK